ncbi:MAG: adenosine kinase [Pseudomonadota bacterium]
MSMNSRPENVRITGIGSALVDLLIHENDDFLENLGKKKGGMTLVGDSEIQAILEKTSQDPAVVSGGAACNTLVGIGRLGGQARFIGQRGQDSYGDLFDRHLKQAGVEPVLSRSETPTGKVLSVITPDAQRSMFTFLGAASELSPESISPDLFRDTAIVMVEGYLLFNRDLMLAALKSARAAGAKIALDLASFEVVEASRPILGDLVADFVDILIANEDEARAYTGHSDEAKALEVLARNVSVAVLKVGKRGSYLSSGNETLRIEPVAGREARDTTGAGDLWAAGFLYGLAHGYSMERSGRIASACGYEVCQVIGAHIPEAGWERVRRLL